MEGSAVSPSHSQLQPESPLSPYHPDRSGGICSALRLSPILPGKGPGATNSQSNPYPQPDLAMPGGNTRLSNKIHPTESTNQLIWTALTRSSIWSSPRLRWLFRQGTYRTSDFLEQSRDRYPLSGTKMGLQLNQKYWGVSCDEIIMANEYRKSLMSLV